MRKMSRLNKFVAIMLFPAVMLAFACTPQQVQSANNVLTKVSFYTALAKSIVQVAETQYADNQKVKTALEATKVSLSTLESVVALVGAGIEKDESKVIVAVVELSKNIFGLIAAIEEAKKAKSSKSVK
jgi:vacuolar-type H+-ATPase catalytic subunit A/Vma1